MAHEKTDCLIPSLPAKNLRILPNPCSPNHVAACLRKHSQLHAQPDRFSNGPPAKLGHIDWQEIASTCDLGEELSSALKRAIQPGLDAIARWLRENRAEDFKTPGRHGRKPEPIGKTVRKKPAIASLKKSPTATASAREQVGVNSDDRRSKPGPDAKPVDDFPEPLFPRLEDPALFQEALVLEMRRHGDTYWHLHRAIVRPGENFDRKTILSWINGAKVPRTLESLDILKRIERRYRLPEGYFKAKLPHRSRAASGHNLGSDIGPAERRRLAWPDDFSTLPFSKRVEGLEWVRRVIIAGSTDYRRYQAAATRQRYAIRFPGLSYGGSGATQGLAQRFNDTVDDDEEPIEDPDLLSGVIDAPPRLAMEMADLIRFKTSTLTVLGFQRNGVWGEETASQKIEHLGLMFGALAASPNAVVQGYGVPLAHLTFGMLVFPGV